MNNPFPAELNYLQPMIQQFPGELLYYATGDAFAASRSRASVSQFAAYYDEIAKRGDDATISKIVFSVDATFHDSTYRSLKNIQLLFEALARRGEAPFNSGRLKFEKPAPGKPNWELLPPDLRYIAPYAEKYGIWGLFDDLDTPLSRLTDEERAELAKLGARIADDRLKWLDWNHEVIRQTFAVKTAEIGHPGDAATYAEHESDLVSNLKGFLSAGRFIPKRIGPLPSPQILRDMADKLEEQRRQQHEAGT